MSMYSPCLPHTCSLKLECCLGRVLALRSFFEFSPPSPSIFSSQLQQSYRRAFILELMKGFNRKHHKMNEPEAEVRRIFERSWHGRAPLLGESWAKSPKKKWRVNGISRMEPDRAQRAGLKKFPLPSIFRPPRTSSIQPQHLTPIWLHEEKQWFYSTQKTTKKPKITM